MSIQNLLSPNHYELFCKQIGDTTNRVEDIWIDDINGAPYPPGGGAVPVLVANKFLRTNGTPAMFWGDVNAAELVHGTSNQILHTNNAGTASEWTSNLTVPGALTSVGNGLFQQDLAVQNELNVTNDLTIINGDLEVTNGDVNLNNLLTFNNVAGALGQIPVSNGSGIPAWSDPSFDPDVITPGALNQVLITGVLPGPVLGATWSDDLDLPGVLNVTGGTTLQSTLIVGGAVTNSSTTNCVGKLTTTNGCDLQGTSNIVNNLQFNSNSGTTGQFIKKTGASTQNWSDLASSDIKGGILNQVLQSDGTQGVFNTDVTLPGNLTVNAVGSITSLLETRLNNVLRLNGLAASHAGQVCVSNALSVPEWKDPSYVAQYYQNAPLVDMNGAANVTLLANASVDIANSNISYLAGVFTLAEAGTYLVTFITNPDTCAAKTLVNFRLNGNFEGSVSNIYIPALVQPQPLTLQRIFRIAAGGATLEVISQPVVVGVIQTSGSDANGKATTMITIQRLGAFV